MLPSDDVMQILEEAEGYSNSMKFRKLSPASGDCGHSQHAFGFFDAEKALRWGRQVKTKDET